MLFETIVVSFGLYRTEYLSRMGVETGGLYWIMVFAGENSSSLYWNKPIYLYHMAL